MRKKFLKRREERQRHPVAAWCFIILGFPVYDCFCLPKSTARQGKKQTWNASFFHQTHTLPVLVLISCSSLSLSLSLSAVSFSPFFVVHSIVLQPTISVSLSIFSFPLPSSCRGTVFVSGLGMGGIHPYGSVQEMI